VNGNLSRIDAFDPKKQPVWKARLGSPYRHRWPLVPPECQTTYVHFNDPLDKVLASHAKRGAHILELDAADLDEATFAKMLARVGAAKVERLAIENVPRTWKRDWLAKLPASLQQLRLHLWQAALPDLTPLAKLPALRALSLFGPYNDGKPVDLKALAKCAALAQLSLQIPHVVLSSPASLVELDLRDVERIETKSIALTMLSIVLHKPNDIGLEAKLAAQIAVAGPGLEELIVHASARKLTKLEALRIPATVRRLSLKLDTRNVVSLKPLAKHTALELLSLQGKLTGLDTLAELSALQEAELFVWGKNTFDASRMTKLARLDTWSGEHDLTIKGWKKPPAAKTKKK
jgi:hypothetical protein